MVELRALNAGHLREIEELQNRIFILEDQLGNRRVAAAPRRPSSVAVKPSPPGALSMRIGDPAAVEVAEESSVEYAGEAALPSRRNRMRPLLRLSGSGRAVITYAEPVPETSGVVRFNSSRKPLRLYHDSLAALRAGRVGVALDGFHKFLARYPHHSYADNVQYWIGESYFGLDQYQAAVRELRRVVERYPHGNKVPDAMLKIGLAHLARGERREGRLALESLCRTYPKHAASRLATERLATEHLATERHAQGQRGNDRLTTTASLEIDRPGRTAPLPPRDLDALTPPATAAR